MPWQRVINAQGRISPRGFSGAEELQRKLLVDNPMRLYWPEEV